MNILSATPENAVETASETNLSQEKLFSQGEAIVCVQDLSRRFGNKQALQGVSLEVKKGQVFGIVGENGAGKTTLIKHLLGLFKPQQGSVRLFGKDPVLDPPGVLSEIGYLSEESDLPAWMTIDELLKFSASFYPKWDQGYADQLVETFELERRKKVKELSKGQRARIGLVLAQAHRPELLLLDEPSSGLDPIVRKDILSAIIKSVSEEGRAVILSSHLLEEVERVCDVLVMMHKGAIILSGALEDILCEHHVFTVKTSYPLADPLESTLQLPNLHKVSNIGPEVNLECSGNLIEITARLKQHVQILQHRYMTLDEIFTSRSVDPDFQAGVLA